MAQVPRFKGVMYTTETLYKQLITEGSITVDGITYNYDPKMLYVTELEIKTSVYSVNGKDGHVNLLSTDLPDSTDLLRVSDIGTGAGQIPVLSSAGKIPEELLPAIALTDIYEADSEVKMLALVAQKGDVCIRTDISKTFVLRGTPADVLANWIELRTPTDPVLSVNGKIGAVELASTDLTDGSTLVKSGEVDTKLNKAIEEVNQNTTELLANKVDNSVFNNLEERVTTTETDILELRTTKADKSSINQDAIRFAEEERQKSKNLLPGDADVDITFVSTSASAMLFSPHCWIYPTQASSSYSTVITFKKTNENEWYFSLNNRNVNEKVYFKFIDLKPNTTYTFSFTPTSISGQWTFLKKRLVTNTILNYTFTTNSNGEYDTKNDDAYFREGLADGISSMRLKNLQLEEGSTVSSYMPYYGQIIHSTELPVFPKLYQHSFGLTVSGSNWRSYGINLMLPTHTKFTISTFAQWLYSKGYKSYNRNDTTGTCLWLSGSNFGAGGGYGTPLAVFSPDGSSIKVQISGSNTLSEDTVNTIIAYSIRDVFSDTRVM